jgi:serine/threonine protein phosphatase 1
MKRLIVGDIHGCFREFEALLDKAGLSADDEIIALGDIVDRGPEPGRVLEFFRAHANVRSLMGNHERKHMRSFRGEIRPALSQLITRQQIGESDYANACAFMDTFPRFLEFPEAILVHGMFEPGLLVAQQKENIVVGTLSGEDYLRTHFSRPWYELYDGEKPLVAGHHDYLGTGLPLIHDDRVFCIDTGCCHGKALTGLILPDFKLISVPSRDDYWEAIQAKYYHLRYSTAPEHDLSWDATLALIRSADRQGDLPPITSERIRQLKQLLAEAERCLQLLFNDIHTENARILSELKRRYPFDELSPKKQGSLYATFLDTTPLAPFLHRARKGALEINDLREHFSKPAEIIEYVKKNGIPVTTIKDT